MPETDLFTTETGLTGGQRDVLWDLAHALDVCGLPLAAIDANRMSPEQRAFWAGYIVIPRTRAAAGAA